MYVAKVAESDTGFYIGVSCMGSLRNYSMTGCYVHCYMIWAVGRYGWVNIQHNQSLTELCICRAQVGLRKQAIRQGEGLLIHHHMQCARARLSSVGTERKGFLEGVYVSRVTGCV